MAYTKDQTITFIMNGRFFLNLLKQERVTFFMSYVLDFNDSEKIMVDGQYHQFYNIVVK